MLNGKINSIKFSWRNNKEYVEYYICVCMIEIMKIYIKAKRLVERVCIAKTKKVHPVMYDALSNMLNEMN